MSILVYSRTAGYRHDSIPAATTVIRSFGYNATFSEDPAVFNNSTSLSRFNALVFLSNSDEILDTAAQKVNLENYLTSGGGLVGIHAATAALFSTPFFGTAFGAYFDYHPTIQEATFTVVNSSHSSTSHLPQRWTFVEEVYNFRQDPRSTNISLLLSVEPNSYDDGNMDSASRRQGTPHPICWYREGGVDLGNGTGTNGMNSTNGTVVQTGSFRMPGRMWYTSLGHTNDTWRNATFQSHIKGGIDWVLAGQAKNTTTIISSSNNNATSVSSANTVVPTSAALTLFHMSVLHTLLLPIFLLSVLLHSMHRT